MDKPERMIGTPKGSAVAQTERAVVVGWGEYPNKQKCKPVQDCFACHSKNGSTQKALVTGTNGF